MKGLYWTFESFASRCTYTAYKGRFAHYKEFLDGFQRKKKERKKEKKRKRKEKVEAVSLFEKRTTPSFTNSYAIHISLTRDLSSYYYYMISNDSIYQ